MLQLAAECVAYILGLQCGPRTAIVRRQNSSWVEWRPKRGVAAGCVVVRVVDHLVICTASVVSPVRHGCQERSQRLRCTLELSDPCSLDALAAFVAEYIERQRTADIEVYYA